MRTRWALAVAASTFTLGNFFVRDAKACGGCFHEPNPQQNVADITDERMLLSVSPNATTLYDQIRYSGNPASFAWVLPIKGTVTIGLSADIMFDSIDALTATQITGPALNCPSSRCGGGGGGVGCGGSASDPSGAALNDGTGANQPPPVTVTKQENVGPYEVVQLHSNTGTGDALTQWLTDRGYEIPDDVKPTVDAYVSEGFDFLAMKLLPNEGVQAMRPVRVTTPGAGFSLPLRMAAVGTGATVGITLWVVSTGRYEPQNFPFFHIEDSDLVWDYATSASNYTSLRAQNEATLQGSGWEIESSIDLNLQTITQAISSGGASVNQNGGGTAVDDAADNYAPIDGTTPSYDPDSGVLVDAGAPGESAEQVESDDIAALVAPAAGASVVRVTRMRTDISHTAMSTDLVVQASADQSELSNQRLVTRSQNAPACPPNNCDDGGCDASAVRAENQAGFAVTFFALVGLFFTRVVRVRRRK